jgi:hypothetical protein
VAPPVGGSVAAARRQARACSGYAAAPRGGMRRGKRRHPAAAGRRDPAAATRRDPAAACAGASGGTLRRPGGGTLRRPGGGTPRRPRGGTPRRHAQGKRGPGGNMRRASAGPGAAARRQTRGLRHPDGDRCRSRAGLGRAALSERDLIAVPAGGRWPEGRDGGRERFRGLARHPPDQTRHPPDQRGARHADRDPDRHADGCRTATRVLRDRPDDRGS